MVALRPAPPDPPRPLGQHGADLWRRAWLHGSAWIAETDVELLLMLCEQVDERAALRFKVLRDGDWRERAGLRALDAAIHDGLSMLAFSPTDRTRLGLAEVKVQDALATFRQRKEARTAGEGVGARMVDTTAQPVVRRSRGH